MHGDIDSTTTPRLRPKMKNDRLIPLLSTLLRVRTRTLHVWRDGEEALSTIGSWSSSRSRDGLALDRSLSRWLVGEQWFPKKVSLDKLYRPSRYVPAVHFSCARSTGGDICLRENLIIARNDNFALTVTRLRPLFIQFLRINCTKMRSSLSRISGLLLSLINPSYPHLADGKNYPINREE